MTSYRFRVLTYNTHLMADSNIVVGAWIANKKPVVFLDDDRHRAIVRKIIDSNADIVALQEVWAASRMETLQKDLEGAYQYHAFGGTGAGLIPLTAELITSGIPARAAGSGIMLLSKYPLSDIEFEVFANPSDLEEKAASKGMLTATVHIHGVPVRIGTTHAWTDAGPGCSNIQQLREKTLRNHARTNAVMMGDFNIHRLDAKKYGELTQIMRSKQDTADAAGGNTDDQSRNNLAQFFSPMRNTEQPDCIDYIYARNVGGPAHLFLNEAKVLTDWKMPTNGLTPKWYWVHEGTVAATPTATPFGPNLEYLCVVTRETEAGLLRAAVCNRATGEWTSTTTLYKQGSVERVYRAGGAPGIVWWDNKLHLFYRIEDGKGGTMVVKQESTDGVNWSHSVAQGIETSGGCCSVVCDKNLYVFVRDPRGNSIRYHVLTPSGWSAPKPTALETYHNISAAVVGNKICVVAKDPSQSSSGLMHVIIENGHPGPKVQITNGATTSGSPGVAAYQGHFEVFYRKDSGEELLNRSSKNNWASVQTTHQRTTDEVCPVTWGDKMLLFFSFVVNDDRKKLPGKLLYPEDAVLYPQRALAHAYWPPDVDLDLSDHYPVQADLELLVT